MEPINYSGQMNLAPQTQGIGGLTAGLAAGQNYTHNDLANQLLGGQIQQQGYQTQMQGNLAAQQQYIQQRTRDYYGQLMNAGGDQGKLTQLAQMYPEQIENIKAGMSFVNDADQNNAKIAGKQAALAFQNGNPQAALPALQARVNYLNSIGRPSDAEQSIVGAIQSGNPDALKQAQAAVNSFNLAYNPDFIKAGTEQQVGQANIGKTGAETAKTYNDIQIDNARTQLDAARVQIQGMSAGLDRDLKMQDLQQKQANYNNMLQQKYGDAASAQIKGQDIEKSIGELLNRPAFNSIFGAGGKYLGMVPGTDAAAAQGQLDHIKELGTVLESQLATKGAGVTDAGRENLHAAFGRLQQAQSPDEARKAFTDVQSNVNKMQLMSMVKNNTQTDPNFGGKVIWQNHPAYNQPVTEFQVRDFAAKRGIPYDTAIQLLRNRSANQ
jgi:hypothetical protein